MPLSDKQKEYAKWLALNDTERRQLGMVRTKLEVATRLEVTDRTLRNWERQPEFMERVDLEAKRVTLFSTPAILAAIRDNAYRPEGWKDRQLLIEKIIPQIKEQERQGAFKALYGENQVNIEEALALLDGLPIEQQEVFLTILTKIGMVKPQDKPEPEQSEAWNLLYEDNVLEGEWSEDQSQERKHKPFLIKAK